MKAADERGRAGAVVLAVLVIAGLIGAGVAYRSRNQRDDGGSGTGTGGTTTTAIDHLADPPLLDAYCSHHAGEAWPEVPAFHAGQPSRTYVSFPVQWNGNGQDDDGSSMYREVEVTDGSTVIAPEPDGRYDLDPSVLARTQSITCVEADGMTDLGTPCSYSLVGPTSTRALKQNRFTVTVYELHSGGILHKGEILSRADGCPDQTSGQGIPEYGVSYPITDADILGWLGSHFVHGAPS